MEAAPVPQAPQAEALIADLRACTDALKRFIRYGHRNDERPRELQAMWNRFAERWKAEMASKTPREKRDILSETILLLHQAHSLLVGVEIQSTHKDLIPLFRSAHDALFQSIGVKRPYVRFKQIPTRVFTEFIKGITYFKQEPVRERPVYHRRASCGTKELAIKEKFHMSGTDSADTAFQKRNAIRLCFIERLIYNDIFQIILHRQDVSHPREMKQMERLYDDVIGGELRVEVKGFFGERPTRVYIIEPALETEQMYEKTPGSPIVRCSKTERGVKYHKYQSFEREEPWVVGDLPPKTIAERVAHLLRPVSI